MTKKTKKKIIYLLHVACHFYKEHQQNNVSERKATLKLTHAIKTNNNFEWEIILLRRKKSFFLFKFFALYESHIFLF